MSLIDNLQVKDDESCCCICMDRQPSRTFKCKTCNTPLCAECFSKMSIDQYSFDKKKVTCYLKCPVCRIEGEYGYSDFDREEIIHLAHKNIAGIFTDKKIEIEKKDKDKAELEKSKKQLEQEKGVITNLYKQLEEANDRLILEQQKITRYNQEIQSTNQFLQQEKEQVNELNKELQKANETLVLEKEQVINLNLKLQQEKATIFELNTKLQEQAIRHKAHLDFMMKCIDNQSNNLKHIVESDKCKTVKKSVLKSFYDKKVQLQMTL